MQKHLIRKLLSNSKATLLCVAFFIFIPALTLLSAPVKNESQQQENILSSFLNQKSQDLYESSASQLIQKNRSSEKNMLACLELEPENLFCKWQQLRLLNYKNDPSFVTLSDAFTKKTEGFPEFGLLAMTLKSNFIFKDVFLEKTQKIFPILFYFSEFQRAIAAQNYSLAKEILQTVLKLDAEYPDLIYMRSKLMLLSQEESLADQNSAVLFANYQKICAALRPELTRKYYYDIDLCHRSL